MQPITSFPLVRSLRLSLCIAGLVGSLSAQDPVEAEIDSAVQTASQTVRVSVDVVIQGEVGNPQMRFIVEWPGGGCQSGFAPASTGLNQEFAVLFPCEIPAGAQIRAEIIWDNSGAYHSPDVEIQ
jgi:hypothetical protein